MGSAGGAEAPKAPPPINPPLYAFIAVSEIFNRFGGPSLCYIRYCVFLIVERRFSQLATALAYFAFDSVCFPDLVSNQHKRNKGHLGRKKNGRRRY